MTKEVARILSIAGSDSGGGAGIQADIKTITMLGGHAMTAITAITAQNTVGVQAVHDLPADFVIAQIDSVTADIGVDAIKIGMLGSAETAMAVADRLDNLSFPVVFDPVMVATSGAELSDQETIKAFGKLMSLATIITPNLPELQALGGRENILRHGGHVLVKGGHADTDDVIDELWSAQGLVHRVKQQRINSPHTHGTGCTLSSALACRLGQGADMITAFEDAVRFVRSAISAAPGLGEGHGPMGHQQVRDMGFDGK